MPFELPQEEFARTAELYRQAVEVHGLEPMGGQCYNGRCSAVQWVAQQLNLAHATVRYRLQRCQARGTLPEVTQHAKPMVPEFLPRNPMVDQVRWDDAVVFAFSDAHWTHVEQMRSVAHEAMLRLAERMRPTHFLAVGDLMDLAALSRHERKHYGPVTKPEQELTAAQVHLGDLRQRSPRAECWWIRGNHDDRLEGYLASKAEALEGLQGTTLEERFPAWHFTHRLKVNDDFETIHVWHRSQHAALANVRESGKNFLTGDSHRLTVVSKVYDARTLYGVETGMLADQEWRIFNWLGARPVRWAQGFVVLTWRGGKLQPPEPVRVEGTTAWFRGNCVFARVKAGRAAA